MATAVNQPIESGGSISIIEDDSEQPFAIQISHDLAVLSVRMSGREFEKFLLHGHQAMKAHWPERYV